MTNILDLDGKELQKELDRIIKANPPKFKLWTKKETEIVKKLYLSGVKERVIANQLGRSFDSVEHFIRRAGLRRA